MPERAHEAEILQFSESVRALLRRLRAASASHGLSWAEASVMARLEREGPATTADLARGEGVRPQSMSATIASLEEMGFVARAAHPTDGRQINIILTDAGMAVRKSAGETKRTWLAQAIGRLSDADRATLFEAGRIIKDMVDHETQ